MKHKSDIWLLPQCNASTYEKSISSNKALPHNAYIGKTRNTKDNVD